MFFTVFQIPVKRGNMSKHHSLFQLIIVPIADDAVLIGELMYVAMSQDIVYGYSPIVHMLQI